jgi:hypothetical protein
MTIRLVRVALCLFVLALAIGRSGPLQAQTSPTFTVTVRSAYLRSAPSPIAPATYSVFEGQTYAITGRTSDDAWLRLAFAAATQGTWIRSGWGTISGSLASVPIAAEAEAVPPAAQPGATSLPVVASASGAIPSLQFTITAASTYARDAPDWQAKRIASLFGNQVVRAIGRDGSGEWLQIDRTGWVPAGVGQLSGVIGDLAITGGQTRAPAPQAATSAASWTIPRPLPAYLPHITTRMRQLYSQAIRRGRNPNLFTIVGDCNSEGPVYLHQLALEHRDLSAFPYLHATNRQFRQSYFRASLAVNGGFTTSSVLDPLWANPAHCNRGESPFACELRVSRASIAFVLLGTGDQHDWQGFEARYRSMIEHALLVNVVPVVVTKADRLEFEEGGAEDDYINNVVRRLAHEYQVPLFDMHQATRDMENRGLRPEPFGNQFHLSGDAIGLHIIGTLQVLYLLTNP